MTNSVYKSFKVGDKVRLVEDYKSIIPDSDILVVEDVYNTLTIGSVKVSGIWVFSDFFDLVEEK